MDSIISTFHIDWKTIIAQMINFGVVFAVLYFFALKPLTKIMKERTKKIEKGIEDAKENQILLDKSKREYDEALEKAKRDANTLYQEIKKEAQEKKVEMLEDAKKEVASIIENGRKTLESEKVKMIAEAKKEVANLVIKVTEKVIASETSPSYEDKVLKEMNNL
ncbi:MAG: F0F1 ATP synthase subunit B [Candidatus Paceibacterota bacterium]|jgi:F-type H+-transporting ATPase subunit b